MIPVYVALVAFLVGAWIGMAVMACMAMRGRQDECEVCLRWQRACARYADCPCEERDDGR